MMTEELSETCSVSFQNKFENLERLVGFIIKKFVMILGHMDVKIRPQFGKVQLHDRHW